MVSFNPEHSVSLLFLLDALFIVRTFQEKQDGLVNKSAKERSKDILPKLEAHIKTLLYKDCSQRIRLINQALVVQRAMELLTAKDLSEIHWDY